MDDFVSFDESCLRKIGVTCPICHTEVGFDIANAREPSILTCPGCHKHELLHLMELGLLGAEFTEKFTWGRYISGFETTPKQPHPPNQPNPNGEGTTLKPDISLATKSGHFDLLPTVRWSEQTSARAFTRQSPTYSIACGNRCNHSFGAARGGVIDY